MARVFKYPILSDKTIAPAGKVVLVDHQGGDFPTMWVEVEDDTHNTEYLVVGTGWELELGLEHVGSAICGQFVWHIYRVKVDG